jgi:hypothetical protein
MDGRRIDRVQFRPAPKPVGDHHVDSPDGVAADSAVVPEHQSVDLSARTHDGPRPALAGSAAVRKDDR